MKKLITLLFIMGFNAHLFAQFEFSGNIANITKADTFYVNIPYIFGYYHDNDVAIAVDAKGNFNTTLNVSDQKFGNIRFDNKAVVLLLTPGKSVVMNYAPADSSITFKGSAAAENSLLNDLDLNGIPFFAKDKNYAKLTLPQIQQKVIAPWSITRDKNITLVQASGLSIGDKKLITQEVYTNYILQLDYFARGIMDRTDTHRIDSVVLSVYNNAPLAPAILPAGPIYYAFANSYISYQQTEIFAKLTPEQLKDPATILPKYNLTIDSGNRVAKLKGKSYVNWLLVRNIFPNQIAESWLAQNIFTRCESKDLAYSKPLLEELTLHFPKSKYLPFLAKKVRALETLLQKNMSNKEIVVADGYHNLSSIFPMISSLKGKVVYLDVWGTWCGPCKDELRYNAALKQQFAGKDVAFVYLDMDEDMRDADWRRFIKVNGISGLHLRKNSKDIERFWDELMPKGAGDRYYPMYFIFDKNGKLVKPNAKRPSDKAELYMQIQQYL